MTEKNILNLGSRSVPVLRRYTHTHTHMRGEHNQRHAWRNHIINATTSIKRCPSHDTKACTIHQYYVSASMTVKIANVCMVYRERENKSTKEKFSHTHDIEKTEKTCSI